MLSFDTASNAFHSLYWRIVRDGVDFAGTKALFNVGFEMKFPAHNAIHDGKVKRSWSQEYAEAEWQWYLSGNRNIAKLGELYGKVPAIWKRMADDDGNVNSNYGWQWNRNDQLRKVINNLKVKTTSLDKLLYLFMMAKRLTNILTILLVLTLYSLQY